MSEVRNTAMRIRLPEFEIIQTEPYANDRLGRKPFGDALASLLKSTEGAFTLAIDGQWGDGKTTFAKIWCEQLKLDGFRAIYFDAFANDHGQDPFAPLSSVLLDAIRPTEESKARDFNRKFASFGYKVLQIGGRVGLRTVSAGLIDEGDIREIASALKDDETDKALGAIEKKLSQYQLSENELNEFRSLLTELAQLSRTKLPLVIILDELDRCRPTFALSLLEIVKHFFSVEGIVFVFVMNSDQMCACIHQIYGSINARQYLHKFIDVECTLPAKRKMDRQESLYRTYTRFLLSGYALDKWKDHDDLKEFLIELAKAFDLSLRDMEKVSRTLALYYAAHGNRGLPNSALICLLAVLKVCDRENYNALANNEEILLDSILDKLGGSMTLKYMRSWFLACTGKEELMDDKYKQPFERSYNLWRSRKNAIERCCERMDFFR